MTIFKEVTKDVSYEATKLRDNNATYRDNKITVNNRYLCIIVWCVPSTLDFTVYTL
jgi:hypothetical protein